MYICFVLYPWVTAVYYSFFRWDGITSGVWVGLENYRLVFSEPQQLESIQNSFVLIFFFSVIPVCLGLVLAATVTTDAGRNWTVSRGLIFMPQVLPLVAVAVAWKLIYEEEGLLNQVLRAVGLGELARAWLGDFTWALPAIGLVGVWIGTGLCMLLFIAGIGKIDQHLYEAVQLDGGGRIREFFTVTLPGLRGEIGVAATVTVISALAGFDLVYVMTNGGPGSSTTVPGIEIYRLAFTYQKVGLASALAVVLTVLVYLFVGLLSWLTRRGRDA